MAFGGFRASVRNDTLQGLGDAGRHDSAAGKCGGARGGRSCQAVDTLHALDPKSGNVRGRR